jgi:MFS family permease
MNSNISQSNGLWARLMAWIRNTPLMRYPDLGLISLGVFVMLIGVGAIVPIRMIYARDHGALPLELGLMASGFLLGQFAFQLPGGWASDKWGRKPLLVAGIAIGGVISFLFLAWDNPWYFIVLRFIEGAASGAIAPAANAYVIDTVPARERGVAFGWLGSAFSAGFMLGPAVGGFMVDALGYESPFIFGGVTILATAFFLAVKMRNVKPGDKPPARIEESASTGEQKVRRQIPQRLFVPALIGALVLTIASGFGDGLFISIWTLWLNDLHASNSFIGFTFITFSLPLMLLMPSTGKMADKYRLAPLIAIPGAMISFVYFTYGVTENLFVIAAIGLLEGAFIAIMIPALSAYVANLSPDNARGRLQGVISTTRTLAGFASAMVVTFLYSIDSTYPFFMLAGVQLVISIVGGLLIWTVEKRTNAVEQPPGPPPAMGVREHAFTPQLEAATK